MIGGFETETSVATLTQVSWERRRSTSFEPSGSARPAFLAQLDEAK